MNDKKVVICKRCGAPEYWGEMRWISGACICRDCYKRDYELRYGKPYIWDDLDGLRPTQEDRGCDQEVADEFTRMMNAFGLEENDDKN